MRQVRRERRVLKPTVRRPPKRVRKVRRKRRRRIISREGHWLRRYRRLRVPRELAWKCRECGCSFKTAQVKRRRRGEQEIRSLLARTCSARCRRAQSGRLARHWNSLHPEAIREYVRRTWLRKRWKLYAEQHEESEPYPDLRYRSRAT